jgi:hypothetical protein
MKYMVFLSLIMLSSSFFAYNASAQISSQINILSQGSVNYTSESSQTPSPFPSQTPTPTSNPTPTAQPSSANLAPINDGKWYTDATWQKCPVSNVYYDTSTTHNGAPTWRVQPGNNYGPDHNGITVRPGQHIVMSCWVKTSGTPSGSSTGARIGFDYYTANWAQRIAGMNSPEEAAVGRGYPNISTGEAANFVPWGSNWTFKVWDFIVPATAQGDGWVSGGVPLGQYAVPGTIVPWCQIFGQNGYSSTYTSWFSDFQFYIHP